MKKFEKVWKDGTGIDSMSWEGEFVKLLYLTGYSEQQITSHFRKISNKQETFIHYIRYMSNEEEDIKKAINSAAKIKATKNDKCLIFYSNDDDITVYDFNINVFLNIGYQMTVTKVASIFNEYKVCIEDYTKEDIEEFKQLAKENNLDFKL